MTVAVLGLVWVTITRFAAQLPAPTEPSTEVAEVALGATLTAAAGGAPASPSPTIFVPTATSGLPSPLPSPVPLDTTAAPPAPTEAPAATTVPPLALATATLPATPTLPPTAVPTIAVPTTAATATPSVTASPTRTPSDTPTVASSATPSATPSATATVLPGTLPEAVVKVIRLSLRSAPGNPSPLGYAEEGTRLKVLGRARGQQWVLAQLNDSLQGWMPAGPDQLELTVPLDALPVRFYRPGTDIIAGNADLDGIGALVIRPHPTQDRVVILVSTQLTVSAVYVRAGEKYTLARVPDGSYTLYTGSGQDWDGFEFETLAAYQRFDLPFVYKTSTGSYTVWRIDLDPANAPVYDVTPVSPSQVPVVVPDTAREP